MTSKVKHVYEVHVTGVSEEDANSLLLRGYKELHIELSSGENILQVQYSKFISAASSKDVISSLNDIKYDRLKVERYTDLPVKVSGKGKYFEFHIKVKKVTEEVRAICYETEAHISRNPQKDGTFLTLRGYTSLNEIGDRFNRLVNVLKLEGISFSNKQFEYVEYDSNFNYDKGWKVA